jgi:hypothetical protein
MNRTFYTILVLFLAFFANAQSPADKPPQQDPPTAKQIDPKLHADAIQLVEVSGAKQRLQGGLTENVAKGKKQMMETCPTCAPAFAEEWEKRMLERIKVNDFLDVYVRVYEKYVTDEEITESIALQSANKNEQTVEPSPALKQKLTSVMPSLMGEALGGCAQIGAKLGGEIGAEIEKEHPEYVKAKAQPNPK